VLFLQVKDFKPLSRPFLQLLSQPDSCHVAQTHEAHGVATAVCGSKRLVEVRRICCYAPFATPSVRRHVRCADRRCDRAGNVTFGARETSRSVRQSCRNVTFGAPIRSGRVCHHRRHWGGARLYSHSGRGTGRPDEGLGGGWRSERDVVGATNVTLGATNVTAYTCFYARFTLNRPCQTSGDLLSTTTLLR